MTLLVTRSFMMLQVSIHGAAVYLDTFHGVEDVGNRLVATDDLREDPHDQQLIGRLLARRVHHR